MLTTSQKKWLAHLSDTDMVVIKPYDPTAPEKFNKVKKRILTILGENTRVEHCGATALGISGQDEIDVYVPVAEKNFDELLVSLKKVLGDPRSIYPLDRARFVVNEQGKHVDIFLINKEKDGWKNGVIFEKYLKTHPQALEAYKRLKENGNGLSTREYYKRKIGFINKILAKAKD